jgi:predicted PurR-regulated permease PerM
MPDFDRNRLGAKAITIALVAAVAYLLLPFLAGLIGSAVLYVLAAPFTRRAGEPHRRVVSFFAVIVLAFALVLPGIWLVVQLLGQVPDAARTLQEAAFVQRLMALNVGAFDIGSQLQRVSGDIVRWSSRQTFAALGGLLSATLNLIIALFGAYYLMISSDRVWERLKTALPFGPTTSELLRIRFHRVTEAMLLGVVLTGVVQGTLVGVTFAVIGFDHALLWGAVTAAVSMLPMFGSAIVWVPGVAVLFAQERYTAAIVLATLGALIVSNADNALRLIVYRRVSHIHPMVTLVGAFAGVNTFGIAGLLLGPLVLSYAIELLRLYLAQDPLIADHSELSRQGFPPDASAVLPTSMAAQPR